MATAKDHITEIIKRQPDDSSYDEIIRELAFDLMVRRGLRDSENGRTIRNQEMERRIRFGRNNLDPRVRNLVQGYLRLHCSVIPTLLRPQLSLFSKPRNY